MESITVYSNLRKTGIDFVKDIPWGTHVCAFYQTKTDLVNILNRLSLSRGSSCGGKYKTID